MNIVELATLYIRHRDLRPDSVRSYQCRAACFLGAGNTQEIGLITSEDVIRYRDAMYDRGCTGTTWNAEKRHLSAMMNWAVKLGYLTQNPFKLVARARENWSPKLVTTDHLKRAMKAIGSFENSFLPHYFWRALTLTLSLTAMRRAQLVGLAWTDIDFSADSNILLRREFSKTGREYRVPICQHLHDELSEFRRIARTRWKANETAFLQSQVFNIDLHLHGLAISESLDVDQVSQFFRRLSERTGIKISAHRLRHRAATELTRVSRLGLRQVQEFLGHSSPLTTMRYMWPDLATTRNALDTLVECQPELFTTTGRKPDPVPA